MIAKIDIERFGLFSNYYWKQHIGTENNQIFNKMNIIYGRNYSGKTTLSRIFRCIEMKQLPNNYHNGIFTITTDNSTITNMNLVCSDKVRVYNTDFVKENLSWLSNEVGDIKPFTLLGSNNVNAEKRITEINEELGGIDEKKGLLYRKWQIEENLQKRKLQFTKAKEKVQTLLTNKANREIKVNNYYVKQGTNYNVKTIQLEIDEIIDSGKNFIINEKEKAIRRKRIDESVKQEIAPLPITKPHLSEYIKEVQELLKRKIVLTQTLEELVTNSLLQEWVDKGRVLNKNRETCAFCGGIITPDRWKLLDAHFSKESEELKKSIEELFDKLERSKKSLDGFLETRGVKQENIYEIFQDEYNQYYKEWTIYIDQYRDTIDFLISQLQERYNDIFTPREISNIVDCSENIIEIINRFNSLLQKNKNKSSTIAKDKDIYRRELRYSEIQSFIKTIEYERICKDWKNEEKSINSEEKKLDDLIKTIGELRQEKQTKELEAKDEGEAAKRINEHLSDFFGHDSLTLEPALITESNTPLTRFIIKRGDKEAHNLSEGECSLISFFYFIAKIEDELNGVDHDKLIIYIDDPISSLDNNHIFFMYSLIETIVAKKGQYGQLFISTHNLDFLKYLKRLTLPIDINRKPLVQYFIIEKRKKMSEAISCLKLMPSYLKDYVTEYNFLFHEIYNMAKVTTKGDKVKMIENQYTHFYNLPNNMRKFLECYLYYRYPNTDNPLANLDKLFDNHIPCLVNRVVNEYSHLAWGNRGILPVDVNEAEKVAKHILHIIREKDNEHYCALCDSIKVDPNIDLE